ncbi:MAG: threonylcarbamoyl-AMP synthase [Saprospiraceae bacterium]|nr:threonylcarbamoyl-AMP synthase [Saprospiraceae bacterium]
MDYLYQIPELISTIEKGGLILYPTETIWGIGCDATNEKAISKLNKLKKRSADKNYILLVDNIDLLSQYISYIPPKARNLIEYFSKPLTIVYDQPKNIPDSLLADDGSIAIRVTSDPFCKTLVNRLAKPIVSTSANISGSPFPTSFDDIEPLIKEGVDVIAEYRQNEINKDITPSTIVKVVDGMDLIFIRK